MTQKNVITAGPACGKSSIIRELSSRGFYTLPEAARMFINQKISEGESSEEARKNYDFQKRLIQLDKVMENNLQNHEIVFLDRSLVDNIAYMKHSGMEPSEDLIEFCKDKYDNVFLLERLEFEDDKARNEDEAEAQEIHNSIRETYIDLGYSIHEIPVVPIDERADKILDVLNINRRSPYRIARNKSFDF